MIIIYFQFHCEINSFQRYWIISFICFFDLSKWCFSSSFSFKNLLFFNSIFSCFFSFQITNICFYFLLFHSFPKFVFFKEENLFLSCNEKNVLPIFKNSKKNFWKSKNVHLFKLIFIKMKIFTVFLEYSTIFYFF